jgi:hypothetical protein
MIFLKIFYFLKKVSMRIRSSGEVKKIETGLSDYVEKSV